MHQIHFCSQVQTDTGSFHNPVSWQFFFLKKKKKTFGSSSWWIIDQYTLWYLYRNSFFPFYCGMKGLLSSYSLLYLSFSRLPSLSLASQLIFRCYLNAGIETLQQTLIRRDYGKCDKQMFEYVVWRRRMEILRWIALEVWWTWKPLVLATLK